MKGSIDKSVMDKAIAQARITMNNDEGGPFGAAVIDMDGTLLSVASNTVLGDGDPTAHAEMNAIRKAAKEKGTHDLSGCILYTTAYPCPMCLGATIWANIQTVVYGCRPEDADAIGFRDDFIYEYIRGETTNVQSVLATKEAFRDECLKLFKEYQAMDKEIY
ncbi:MAG: nucleoside deaminase [Bacillota bacterium]